MSVSTRVWTSLVLGIAVLVGMDAVQDHYEDQRAGLSRSIDAIGPDWQPSGSMPGSMRG